MSAQRCRNADAAGLVGANTAIGDRWTPICSMTLALGIAVGRKPGTSAVRCANESRAADACGDRPSMRTAGRIGGRRLRGEEVGELVEGAFGQGRGDRRHDQRVGGVEHALAGERDPGSAVEQGDVVVDPSSGSRSAAEPSGRAFGVVELRGRGGAARSRPARCGRAASSVARMFAASDPPLADEALGAPLDRLV